MTDDGEKSDHSLLGDFRSRLGVDISEVPECTYRTSACLFRYVICQEGHETLMFKSFICPSFSFFKEVSPSCIIILFNSVRCIYAVTMKHYYTEDDLL